MARGSASMYKNSPRLEKGEDGKVGVSKNPGPTKAEKTATAENGQVGGEPIHEEMMARHNLDRHTMHAAHEHEHAMHKGGDKHEMHERHHGEMKKMLKKHEDEMGSGREDAETKGAKIENKE